MSFETLPTETLQFIFSFTTWSDQRNIGLVCRRLAAAVEPMLLARTRLKVSCREFARSEAMSWAGTGGNAMSYDHAVPTEPIRLIDKRLLSDSNRNYSCLKVEWGTAGSGFSMTTLQETLDVCQQRFPVRILYLKGPLSNALTEILLKYRKWLESLTELHFEDFCASTDFHIMGSASIELSLPSLKQLTWIERVGFQPSRMKDSIASVNSDGYRTYRTFYYDLYQLHATLHVPELERLRLRVERRSMTTPADLDLEYANNCYLFQPGLYFKSCTKLQHVDILEFTYLDQHLVNLSEPFLQNMKTLTMFKCGTPVIKMICERCSKLEELTIDEAQQQDVPFSSRLPFTFSAALSHSLKKLTLKKFRFILGEAVFPELRCLSLTHVGWNSVTLVAPQLTKLIISRTAYNRLTIVHKDQIHTMVVDVEPDYGSSISPPANLTELTLYEREIPYKRVGLTLIQDYLNLYSDLRRLTVVGSRVYRRRTQLDLNNFSNLEYLCAYEVAFRLSDFHELTQLKSLILSYCSLETTPDDTEVKLNTLEQLRLEGVIFADIENGKHDNRAWDHFPIYGSGRQPPVVKCNGIFRTPMFHLRRLDLDLPDDVYWSNN